jgi:integrase
LNVTADDDPTLEPLADGTGHRVRVRFGKERRRITIPTTDVDLATARARVLIRMGADLAHAPAALAHEWLKRAGAADGPELKRIQAAVAKLASGAVKVRAKVENPRMFWTVQELGEAWTKGDLAKEYPDQIHRRRSERDDEIRLERHVYPVVGAVRVRDLTVEECETVMRSISSTLAINTRRNVGLTLGRILTLAVYPLKIITASPFPKGLLPRAPKGKGKALADYRPADDAQLLACAKVPLAYRLLWGFLAREGMRSSEAIQLRWGDVDLKDGSVVLDENKSDDPRSWPLDPGVVRALKAFKPTGAGPRDLIFVEENGGEHNRHALAKTLREHLRAAGLEEGARAKLFEHSKTRLQVRAHDLRAGFVTTALANGRTETWVADRTGHKSHSMIKRYTRQARTAGDLKRGDWNPLDVALGLKRRA